MLGTCARRSGGHMKVSALGRFLLLALAALHSTGAAQDPGMMLVNFSVPEPTPLGRVARSRIVTSVTRWQGLGAQPATRLQRTNVSAYLARSGIFSAATADAVAAAPIDVKDVVTASTVTYLGHRVSLRRGRGSIALTNQAVTQNGFDSAPKLTVLMPQLERRSQFSLEVNSALLGTDGSAPAGDDYRVVFDQIPADLQVSKTVTEDGKILLDFTTGDAAVTDQAVSFELYRTFPSLNPTLYGEDYLRHAYGAAAPPGTPTERRATIQSSSLRWTPMSSLFNKNRAATVALNRPPLKAIFAGFKLAPAVFKDPAQAISDGDLGRKNGYTRSEDTPLYRAIQSTGSCLQNIVSLDGADLTHAAHGWVFGASPTCYDIKDWQHEGTDFRAQPGQPIYAMLPGVVNAARPLPGGTVRPGGAVEVTLGRFTDSGGYANDVVMRYLHLNACQLQVQAGQTVRAGQLLGYISSRGTGPCTISFGPHFHLDVKVIRSRPAAHTSVSDYYFVDSLLFVNQVYRYLQNAPTADAPVTPDRAPTFTGWTLERCVRGSQAGPVLTAGAGVHRCDITIDTVPNGARPVRAEFSYELSYPGADGRPVRIALPDMDVWDTHTSSSPLRLMAQGAQLRITLPLSVRKRPDRVYTELLVIGRLYFDNRASKTITQVIKVQ